LFDVAEAFFDAVESAVGFVAELLEEPNGFEKFDDREHETADTGGQSDEGEECLHDIGIWLELVVDGDDRFEVSFESLPLFVGGGVQKTVGLHPLPPDGEAVHEGDVVVDALV
jgi:hypothetical protein